MKVRDYFVQGRRGWVRLHEKGGKEHEVPCHHSLEQYLDEYIASPASRENRPHRRDGEREHLEQPHNIALVVGSQHLF